MTAHTKNNANKPIVLIDMDGVLADFDAEVRLRISQQHSHITLRDNRQNFYFSDDYPEHATLLRAIAHEQGFFTSLPVVDHALEGWQRIIDLGYHPQICSSPIRTNPYSESEKRAWLKKHFVPVFGDYVAQEAIITSDKHLFDGIALIDDRPVVRHAADATWQHIIFDQPYNQNIKQPRIHGWLDDNLASVLQSAQ